jgi:hypothetical protein
VPFLHGVRDAVIKDRRSRRDGNAIRTSGTEAQDGSYATYEKGEDIWQDIEEDGKAGDRKVNSRVFDWAKGLLMGHLKSKVLVWPQIELRLHQAAWTSVDRFQKSTRKTFLRLKQITYIYKYERVQS